jgi:predicted Zn-dependent protease
LASAQRSKGEVAKAYENIRKSIALNPQREAAHITLANILFGQNQYRQAITELEALIKQQKKESAALFALLGDAYRQDKSLPKAYENARKAIALSPRYAYAHWLLGRTYADEEKFPDAIASAKDALSAWAEYGSAQSLLYQSCHRIKKDEEGLQFLEQLLAKNPESRQLLTSIGFVSHEYTREYEKAYEAFRRVYEQAPEDWSVIENYAEANLTTGRLDAVLELTKKVLSSKDASIQSKLSMRLFQVAAYLMRGEQGLAFSELGSFRDEYGKVPPDYARGWTYEGSKNYVDTRSKLRPAEKSLLLRMMDLLEAPQEQAAAKLKQFEASLAETFADLKATASAAH